MYTIDTYSAAVFFLIITMICWGSWPNTQKLAGKSWRFELFYWDYVIGILLVSTVMALTLGSNGPSGRDFRTDLNLAQPASMLSALIGGVVFNAANILFIAAIATAGMSVAFPVSVGLAMVLGIFINYAATPAGDPYLLFSGTALVVLAILFSATAYARRSKKINSPSAKGILLAITAGVLFGFFYRFIAASMALDFNDPEPGKLTPYTAVLFFALGTLLSNFLFNTILMYKPLEGRPLAYRDYFKGNTRNHIFGILGGIIWGFGLSLSILSSGKTGFAISFGLGQGNAMIAAVWGVFIWKEFRDAPPGTNKFIYLMFVSYIVGLLLIILARS